MANGRHLKILKLVLGTVLQVLQKEDAPARRYLVVRTALSEERANKNLSRPLSSAANARVMRSISSPYSKSSRSTFFHVKNATQHLHQNCLCTLTSSYRHLANSYTLLNASTTYTICWPGVESSYTSICLSFGNSLYVISQRWLNTNRYARIY